jgi:Fur family transcriptional regulator, ferric uptake regulator
MSQLIQESKKRLRAQGGRMTAQRRLILEALDKLSNHPTAEELFVIVKQKDATLHLSTVYRTLRWLEQEELVSARVFDDDRRQERFDAALPSEHHHFVCSICKNVIEFDTGLFDDIKQEFENQFDAMVQSGSIVLYGRCRLCKVMEEISDS